MRICRASLTAAMSRHSFRDGNNNEKTQSQTTSVDAGCHMSSPWLLSLRALMAHVSEQKSWRTTRLLKNSQFALQKERRVFQPLLFRAQGTFVSFWECIWNTSGCVRYIFEAIYRVRYAAFGDIIRSFLGEKFRGSPMFSLWKNDAIYIIYIHDYMCMYIDTICKYTVYTCVFIAVCFFIL